MDRQYKRWLDFIGRQHMLNFIGGLSCVFVFAAVAFVDVVSRDSGYAEKPMNMLVDAESSHDAD